jgi:hypothetical protein
MNLAKHEDAIKAKIRELETQNTKKDTVSFLTLRQALAVANPRTTQQTQEPPSVRERFTIAMKELADLLPEFESIESAEDYAGKARQELEQTLNGMRKENEEKKKKTAA